ncbi:hypothetical protein BD779DRAFT_1678168 [Infundibulicybe gibba]|nr:hypothetical protein BD779DRAFT_1678168 [Infundibulicybe gibba]
MAPDTTRERAMSCPPPVKIHLASLDTTISSVSIRPKAGSGRRRRKQPHTSHLPSPASSMNSPAITSPSAFFAQLSLQSPLPVSPQPRLRLQVADMQRYRGGGPTSKRGGKGVCTMPTPAAAATPTVTPQCTREFHTRAFNNNTTTRNALTLYSYDARAYDC